jgi:hypothetical protein
MYIHVFPVFVFPRIGSGLTHVDLSSKEPDSTDEVQQPGKGETLGSGGM